MMFDAGCVPSDQSIPQFGVAGPGRVYTLRPGGYAVIFNHSGEVALCATPRGLHLPGGGQEQGETPRQAAIREVYEECGLEVCIVRPIGMADELCYSAQEDTYYRKRCAFFLAEVMKQGVGCEPDHRLAWIPLNQALSELVHECHRWAISRCVD